VRPDGILLFLLSAFAIGSLRMIIRILRVMLSLGGVLSTLRMVIFAMRFGSSAMGLCSGLVMFCCRIMRVFHSDFSCWPTNRGW
jgi:hypothetical protein